MYVCVLLGMTKPLPKKYFSNSNRTGHVFSTFPHSTEQRLVLEYLVYCMWRFLTTVRDHGNLQDLFSDMLFCISVSKTEHFFKKIKTILHHSNKFPLPSSDQLCMCGTREAGREVWCSWLCSTAVDRGYLGEDVDTRQHFSNAICKGRHQDHSISVCGFLTNSGDSLQIT